MNNQSEEVNSASAERRTFLGIVTGAIAAAISVVMGVTIGRFTVAPAFSSQASGSAGWTDVGPLEELEEGKPVRFSVLVSQNAGWGTFNSQRPIWVIKNGDKITVFSAVCPHLGCTVNTSGNDFICACHDSRWDTAGQLHGGPSPRGLDLLEHRVENDMLQVKYQDFVQGIPTKEAII
jgi:Rieske Fe-S protein